MFLLSSIYQKKIGVKILTLMKIKYQKSVKHRGLIKFKRAKIKSKKN